MCVCDWRRQRTMLTYMPIYIYANHTAFCRVRHKHFAERQSMTTATSATMFDECASARWLYKKKKIAHQNRSMDDGTSCPDSTSNPLHVLIHATPSAFSYYRPRQFFARQSHRACIFHPQFVIELLLLLLHLLRL